MTICAIHQPNFFPWLGYFDKIRSADVFVFLDTVSYPRMGSKSMASRLNRVKVLIGGEPAWVGCTLNKARSNTPIRDVTLSSDTSWRRRMLNNLERAYSREKNFDRVAALVAELLENTETSIADFNIHAIKAILSELGLTCQLVRQSDIATTSASNALLIEIVKSVGASTYLCGGGASGYQDDALFDEAGIEIKYQDFEPQPYGDPQSFVPGLSVIDFLMKSEDWSKF